MDKRYYIVTIHAVFDDFDNAAAHAAGTNFVVLSSYNPPVQAFSPGDRVKDLDEREYVVLKSDFDYTKVYDIVNDTIDHFKRTEVLRKC